MVPRKKSPAELHSERLVPLPMTKEDWQEFLLGVELFNNGKFWRAHEAWEQVWRRHPEDSRMFLQGLILVAAAYHTLVEKRRYIGTLNNFEKALTRLRLFEPEFMGISVTPLVRTVQQLSEELRRRGLLDLSNFKLKFHPKIELNRKG